MKYAPIPSALFVENRKRLFGQMAPKSLAVLHSNDLMPTNADAFMPFHQNNDLFYLSGIDQEESILLLFPHASDEKHREMLFVRETNELIAIWEGAKLTKKHATEVSGIKQVHWLSDFPRLFREVVIEAESIYLNANEHPRASVEVESRDRRFIRDCQEKFPLHQYRRLAPLLHQLRPIKSSTEVDLISKACEITESGFRRILSFVRPGVAEYEIEAEFIHEFKRQRSNGFAYSPIIASSGNSCVLHYIENNCFCKDGDILLLDVGAEYSNYNADMTRTIPVNGRFSVRQRAVYDAVLRVLKEASAMLQPGTLLKDYQKQVGQLVEGELIDLGLLDAKEVKAQDSAQPLFRKYFMHGTAHHLGLDVHDIGNTQKRIEAGMVFTCEPGIYIREENLGIRLENNLLITNDGPVNLMETIPIEADEIEDLMNEGK